MTTDKGKKVVAEILGGREAYLSFASSKGIHLCKVIAIKICRGRTNKWAVDAWMRHKDWLETGLIGLL